jgi:hypothetical protein
MPNGNPTLDQDDMPFTRELTEYEKTILSDLQGVWNLLRNSVVDAAGFEG